jgi:Skp family chaperone for outer membrane proteins
MEEDHEERFQRALRELKDGLIVTNAIQARHANWLKDLDDLMNAHNKTLLAEEERLQAHAEALLSHDKMLKALSDAKIKLIEEAEKEAEFRARTEQNLLEITEKLNGLIGYMEGQHRPPQ